MTDPNSAVPQSILPEQQIFFFLVGNYARGNDLSVFQTFPYTINTPKEWFLSKKGPIFHFNLLTAVDSNGGNDGSDYNDINNVVDEDNED